MSEHIVHAPFPGTFYRRPDPDSDVFVAESQHIEAGTTIGLIEVMKMFQEIKVEQSGTLVEFLVDSDTPVDAGEPIARLA